MEEIKIKKLLSTGEEVVMGENGCYRIVERMGRFSIQKKVERSFGWFKKEKQPGWAPIDINGFAIDGYNSKYYLPLGDLGSLEAAQKIIELLKKGTVYHEC